jgi:hypothetical protein
MSRITYNVDPETLKQIDTFKSSAKAVTDNQLLLELFRYLKERRDRYRLDFDKPRDIIEMKIDHDPQRIEDNRSFCWKNIYFTLTSGKSYVIKILYIYEYDRQTVIDFILTPVVDLIDHLDIVMQMIDIK